jgi:hypothetical protein
MTKQHPHPDRLAEVYICTPVPGRATWLGYTVEPIGGAEWHPDGYWLLPADSDCARICAGRRLPSPPPPRHRAQQ